jgi:hypothetical protein
MLEKDIEKAVCEYARKTYGAQTYKFTSPARRNVPDRIFAFPGVSKYALIFIEFKATGKKMTAGQIREATRLRECGQMVFCIDDVEEGEKLVDTAAAAS